MEAHLLINVSGEEPARVAREITKIEEVKNVHIVFGDCDIIAHVEAKDLITLREVVLAKVTKIKGVKKNRSLIVA